MRSLLKRRFHNSVIIKDKLLILTGITTTNSSEIFYLDLSKPFDSGNLTWTLIPNGNLPVYTSRSTAVLSLDNSTIYLIGGFMRNKYTLDYDYSNLIYTYDYPTSTWSTPALNGDEIPPRQDIKGVIDNLGIIYIFGGYNATDLVRNIGPLFNDMNILNTSSNTWTTLNLENRPTICDEYAANILPNGIIVYIGGVEQVNDGANFTLVNMNKIKLFNTYTYQWSQMNATGDEIDPRWFFSSVLTPDGHIIIFGGCTRNFSGVSPNLAVLDTTKKPFEWSIPSNSKINSPPSIRGHTANLYYDYMIIIFGLDTNTGLFSSQVYLYNIKSNNWVTTFSPPENEPSINTPENEPSINTPGTNKPLAIYIGIGIAIGIGAAFFVFGIYIAKSKCLHKPKTVVPEPVNTTSDPPNPFNLAPENYTYNPPPP
ncbi:hypothetical protein Glove_23g73 [Diversispora epigaea]|uniref:Galactose oxidase n=1 Tax=Diversispora epigaea TaxID=1348612 RepID=A0A397JNL9_9GLOM|nr:hypothetical protein Glove_23g73 [Diversispora epigaea]